MATGRGRVLRQLCLGLQALHLPLGGLVAAPGSGGFRKGPGDNFAAGCTAAKQSARREGNCERSSAPCSVSLDGLPSEVLLKILSYLDAVTLLCTGCVNRRFYHLANDNFIWIRIYSTAFSPKRSNWKVNSVEKTAEPVNLLSVEAKEAGYWKKEYITKQIASVKAALAQVLRPVDPYTGLPVKTKEALRMSGLGWVIILKEQGGREHVMEHVDLSMNDSSVTVMWYGKNWPRLATLSTLDLCGVTPVFTGRSKTATKNGPRWHSLIAKYSLEDLPGATVMGCDGIVRLLRLNPGLLVGLWKREEELAFVMATLHFHRLVERSTLGSAAAPCEPPAHTPPSDDSPEHGLRGCRLHVDMHSGGTSYLCSTFHNLFAEKGWIKDGYVKLTAIRFHKSTEHLPLIGDVGFSWRTDVLDGHVKSCSIMDITLLDGYGKPFWCFSSPVSVSASPSPPDGPHFLGQTYSVDYVDSTGQVRMELVWIEETEEYFIVSLALDLSTAKINHWFGTRY